MRRRRSFGSPKPRIYQTRPSTPKNPREHPFTDRQERIPEFDQAALRKIVVIGTGGLGSWPALGLTQAGVKTLLLVDRDFCELSNCNRQFLLPSAVGHYKVEALGAELARFGAGETRIETFPYHFEEMVALYGPQVFADCQVAVVGVDSEESRVAASRHFRALQIPTIFGGVSLGGKTGFVLIQSADADGACYGCVYTDVVQAVSEQTIEHPCPRTPAMSPILHALSGLILEAVFSVLMPKLYHEWNHWYLVIDASVPGGGGGSLLPRREDCGREEYREGAKGQHLLRCPSPNSRASGVEPQERSTTDNATIRKHYFGAANRG
jgi:molybdopterin/thiamine biosynthesis adenylyltransferase